MSDYERSATLSIDDAGVVTGRIAPFDEITDITGTHPDTGEKSRYREVFRRGAFRKMIAGLASRGWTGAVALNLNHRSDVDSQIGYATHIEERADGAWATFALYDSAQLDKIKSMLSTSHKGLSIGFMDGKHRTNGDLVERLVAHVDHVAATPTAAYAGAMIATVRSEDLCDLPELPTPMLDKYRKELEDLAG